VTTTAAKVAAREGECWQCGAPVGRAPFCAACERPQPLAADTDLFAVLDLPRSLTIDADELATRYHRAARALHPDRHATGDERERALSLAATALVNRAYRTLRDPVARGRYWLALHGDPLGDANNTVPPALAELVFDTQELLEELRGGSADVRPRVEAVHGELRARLDGLIADLADVESTGTAGSLGDLKRRLSEIAYLTTLAGDVEAALEG
jgi:molecular chaperone HscB